MLVFWWAFQNRGCQGLNNRGTARGELGKLKEAMEDFKKAIELNPELSHAYFNRDKVKALLE